MKHGSLFSGIGGFDLAAEWMGWQNVFQVEINNYCQQILIKNFPDVERHRDIKTTNFKIYRGRINVLTGGDPCQPHSVAGKKRGKEDDRYLWPEYKRAVKEILPEWAVNENVRGSLFNGIVDEKISDLEAIGYNWWPPIIIPACAVGAFHKRERVWLVANLNGKRVERGGKEQILEKSCLPIRQVVYPFQENERLFNSFESRLCRSLYGLPNGVDRIKALGNAIVPQVAYEIFKAIEHYEIINQNE